MNPILNVQQITVGYGALPVIQNLSFQVKRGEIFGIIGPNGAGKSTLFKTLTGEVLPASGTITFEDSRVEELMAHQRVRLGIGRTFQVSRVFRDYTVRQNIESVIEIRERQRLLGGLFARPALTSAIAAEADNRIHAAGLAPYINRQAGLLSHGDKKRLELLMALALEPKVLMLDEPTAGMSPGERVKTADVIVELRRQSGLTVLLTEHDMDMVFRVADRILVLSAGQVVAIGSPAEIRSNEQVQTVYLGKEIYHA